ncbi:hypothetical protein HDU67_007487 [Dinochytrium kinnereticum]|nr:hypothetical protein HDU67_007487 [Dinochytrium kinnereticum]
MREIGKDGPWSSASSRKGSLDQLKTQQGSKDSLASTGSRDAASQQPPARRKEGISLRAQKERELARDIKLVLRADAWSKLPDLLSDWALVSGKDIMVECGIQFLSKERAMCEKILKYVANRGPLKLNEYPYASALIHLAECQFYLSKWEECTENLTLGIKFIEQQMQELQDRIDNPPKPSSQSPSTAAETPSPTPPKSPATMTDWSDLKDWASMFLAVMKFRGGTYEETLRLLDTTSNYQLVLNSGRFAFFTLLKAKSLYKLGQSDEAIKALLRRQSQEEALSDLIQETPLTLRASQRDLERLSIEDFRKTNCSVFSPEGSVDTLSDSYASVQACHDLHILLLYHQGREEEAVSLYKEFREDGAKRISPWREFVKRCKVEEVGKGLVESWTANPSEIPKRM